MGEVRTPTRLKNALGAVERPFAFTLDCVAVDDTTADEFHLAEFAVQMPQARHGTSHDQSMAMAVLAALACGASSPGRLHNAPG